MRRWAILLTVLVLAGCHKKAADVGDAAAPAAAAAGDSAASAAGGEGAKTAVPPATAMPLAQLAYDYAYRLSLPSARIQAMYDWHQQACAVAGPSVCQVVGAALQKSGKAVVSAHLELRATPEWINHFRGGLDSEAEAAGGEVEAANTAAEDLTRAMVDNQAGLKAKTGLRNRLEKDVATRDGKLSDAVEAEKAVAEVQGDIDTQRAELAAEKTRVATSRLTLDYAPASDIAPLFGWFGKMLAYLAPIALVGALIAWIARRSSRKAGRATTLETPQT